MKTIPYFLWAALALSATTLFSAQSSFFPYYPFYEKSQPQPGYLSNSIIRPLRFAPKPYSFNRLNLANHELLVFEVKSVTTEIAPESIIPPDELKALDDQASAEEIPEVVEIVDVPQVDPEVISTKRTRKLDVQSVIPLLQRFQDEPGNESSAPLFLGNTENPLFSPPPDTTVDGSATLETTTP